VSPTSASVPPLYPPSTSVPPATVPAQASQIWTSCTFDVDDYEIREEGGRGCGVITSHIDYGLPTGVTRAKRSGMSSFGRTDGWSFGKGTTESPRGG
jgi:hypothetical protein